MNGVGRWLIVVTGWTGAGKSTMADRLGQHLGVTVVSFDWVMSGLRAIPEVWEVIEYPIDRQRRTGWNLLSRVAEQQLRRGMSCVLDLVARQQPCEEWRQLAAEYDAQFAVIECVCSDPDLHRSRVEGRERAIPGWYELSWDHVERGRELYQPLAEPKVVIDATEPVDRNFARVMEHLEEQRGSPREEASGSQERAAGPHLSQEGGGVPERATDADIPSWLEIVWEVEPLFGPMPMFDGTLARSIARGGAWCIRDGNGSVVAGMIVSPRERAAIDWLAVRRSARGNGHGRSLVAHAITELAGEPETIIDTFGEDNAEGRPARRLYESLGFVAAEPLERGPEGGTRQRYRLQHRF